MFDFFNKILKGLETSEILPIAGARWLAIALRVAEPVVIPYPFKERTSGGQAIPKTWNAILPHDNKSELNRRSNRRFNPGLKPAFS